MAAAPDSTRATSTSVPPPEQTRSFKASLLALLGVSFVVMLVALDQTVVSTASPKIVADLQGFHLYAWIATSYLLVSVITVPIFGRLGDDFGRKPFVIASIIIFTVASMLCGLAGSMTALIAARALQGLGGGMLIGTAFACIPDLFPLPHIRLRWQAVTSASYGIATAAGPTLGGFLTQSFGWRSTFYVNLPVGLLSLYFVWRFLPWIRHRQSTAPVRIDWLGAVLLAVVLGGLQLAFEQFQSQGIDGESVGLIVMALLAAFALWHWERRVAQPILPVSMFSDAKLSSLFVLSALAGFTMYALLFYAPLLFQGGLGMDPRRAGLTVTPLVVCITLGSITSARVVTRLPSATTVLYVGFALLTICCAGVILSGKSVGQTGLMMWMALGGLGLGCILPNLTVFAQEQAGRGSLGTATALLQSVRMMGGMLGAALTGALVTHFYSGAVHAGLEQANALQWYARVVDPQILINQKDQTALLAELARDGHNGGAILELARNALVNAIHLGLALAGAVAAWSIWQLRRVPAIRFKKRHEAAAGEAAGKEEKAESHGGMTGTNRGE